MNPYLLILPSVADMLNKWFRTRGHFLGPPTHLQALGRRQPAHAGPAHDGSAGLGPSVLTAVSGPAAAPGASRSSPAVFHAAPCFPGSIQYLCLAPFRL